MLTLAQPLWLATLPVVLVLAWFGRKHETPAEAALQLVHPHLGLSGSSAQPRWRQRLPWLLSVLAAVFMVLALARPQWQGATLPETPLGRDIVLLVDVSTTMSIDDFELDGRRASRLQVLKGIAKEFVAARRGDRFGLVVFGSQAATLAPPTFDAELVSASLERLQIGIAGEATALGDAIGLALKAVDTKARLRPALLVFSDGDNTAGELRPSEAVAAAQSLGVAIYTIEIGTDLFQRGAQPLVAEAEPGLEAMAIATGGKHYRAGTATALRQVIDDIGRLEPSLPRAAGARAVVEWYWLCVLVSALLLIARGLWLAAEAYR